MRKENMLCLDATNVLKSGPHLGINSKNSPRLNLLLLSAV